MVQDRELFGATHLEALRSATRDLSWLIERGYSEVAALKLVGDRHGLDARQRKAVTRCACSDGALVERLRRRVGSTEAVAGRVVLVDGLNVLITLQNVLAGALVIRGRDRCLRDLAGVHGAFRPGRHTRRAIEGLGLVLGACQARWYLDRPVSGSGQLRSALLEQASCSGWSWEVELHADPDQTLVGAAGAVAATSDSGVLDRCGAWFDAVGEAVALVASDAWVVDLGDLPGGSSNTLSPVLNGPL